MHGHYYAGAAVCRSPQSLPLLLWKESRHGKLNTYTHFACTQLLLRLGYILNTEHGYLGYHRPIMTNACPPKRSQLSLHLKLVPILMWDSEVVNLLTTTSALNTLTDRPIVPVFKFFFILLSLKYPLSFTYHGLFKLGGLSWRFLVANWNFKRTFFFKLYLPKEIRDLSGAWNTRCFFLTCSLLQCRSQADRSSTENGNCAWKVCHPRSSLSLLGWVPPRGRVLHKVLYNEVPPWDSAPYPIMYYFWQKRYPFRIPSIDKWYPFHIPCLGLCIPFNCCKCTVFEIWINHKTRMFSRIHRHKIHHLAVLGFLQKEETYFPTLWYTSAGKIPALT